MTYDSDRREADLYRTRWLMAHNAVHEIAVEGMEPKQRRDDYLHQLQSDQQIASAPA
jgi:hypothetical protein